MNAALDERLFALFDKAKTPYGEAFIEGARAGYALALRDALLAFERNPTNPKASIRSMTLDPVDD